HTCPVAGLGLEVDVLFWFHGFATMLTPSSTDSVPRTLQQLAPQREHPPAALAMLVQPLAIPADTRASLVLAQARGHVSGCYRTHQRCSSVNRKFLRAGPERHELGLP